jgi:hypothetical protein
LRAPTVLSRRGATSANCAEYRARYRGAA